MRLFKTIRLQDYVKNAECNNAGSGSAKHHYSELAPMLDYQHRNGVKVYLVGFDGKVKLTNHLGRKNNPWYRPGQSEFGGSTESVLQLLPRSVQQCVFAVLDRDGDQQYTETLKDEVQCLFEATVFELKCRPRNEAAYDFDACDGTWPNRFPTPAGVSEKGLIRLKNEYLRSCNGYGEVTAELCIQYRRAWRVLTGSKTDCRTYIGQPARDMKKAA